MIMLDRDRYGPSFVVAVRSHPFIVDLQQTEHSNLLQNWHSFVQQPLHKSVTLTELCIMFACRKIVLVISYMMVDVLLCKFC